MAQSVLGIVGGSGVYDMPGLDGARWRRVASPWGEPSDAILFADVDGLPVRFLPRHGRDHQLAPTDIDYRANVDALKRAGVTDLLSVSAVGSLREGLAPGDFVLVDQFIDRTYARSKSFFGAGCVAHVSMAQPVSPALVDAVGAAGEAEGVHVVRGGTYLVMEGPQFSTRAESFLYRSWGCDVVGMTNMPEAKLAREAELCYATLAMVTDYDCWHDTHAQVEVPAILAVVRANTEKAQRLVRRLIATFPREHARCPAGSDRALDGAVLTPEAARDPARMARLDAVARRFLAREA